MRFLSLLALAAGSATASEQTIEQILVTASNIESGDAAITSAATVIDTAQLTQRAPMHLAELISQTAGVNYHRGSGQESLPAIRSAVLTGAGGCGSVRVAYDGVPVRAAGFCNVNELFDLTYETSDAAVILRGPASVKYGSNAQLGVVNVISAKPSSSPRLSVGTMIDSLGATALTLTGDTAVSNDWAIRGEFVDKHDSGFREDSGFKLHKGRVALASNDGRFLLAANWADLDQQTAGYITGFESYKDDDIRLSNPNPEAYRDAQSASFVATYKDNGWRADVLMRNNDMQFLMHFLPGQPVEQNGHQSIAARLQRTASVANATWVIGGEVEQTDGYLKQWQDKPTQGSPFLQATIPVGKHYDYRVDALSAGMFIEVQYRLSDQLLIQGGSRIDYIEYDYDNQMLDGRTDDQGNACGFGGCRYSRPSDRTDSFSDASAFLGASYDLNPQLNIYANVATGFRAPQATELYRLQRAQTAADLESEQTHSFELGIKGGAGNLAYDLAAYVMKRDELIYRDAAFFNQSGAATDHTGVEFDLSYQFNDYWSVSSNGSYAVHQYADGGTGADLKGLDIDSAPRWLANSSVNYQANSLTASLVWSHTDAYFTNPLNSHRYEGHDLLDLITSYKAGESLLLRAQVLNLTDQRYADRADFTTFGGDRYFPGRERRVVFGFEYQY